MKRFPLFMALLVAVAVSPLFAQTAVMPPPRPAGTNPGPTLDVTMKFIQDKLNDIGTINFKIFWQTTNGVSENNNWSIQVSNVVVDPAHCSVQYHWNSLFPNSDYVLNLKDVEEIKVVTPFIEVGNGAVSPSAVHSTITTDPALTAVVLIQPHGKHAFPFTDPEIADRVAKAFNHAVELCGGGNKEPF